MREAKHGIKQIAIAAIVTGVLFSTGCANLNNPGEIDSTKLDLTKYATLTTLDAVKDLEKTYQQKQQQQKLDFYAPKHYSTAGKAIKEAKNLLSSNGPRDQVVQKVAVAEAVLNNGEIVVRRVKDILNEELDLKDKLDSLQAESVYRSEYSSLLDRLNGIIQEIETGKVNGNDENRAKLIKDMRMLSQRSIRYNAMHEPQEILKRVKYRGGEQLAPITFQDAIDVFKRAEQFIEQNPNYETGIEQIGNEALFAAKRALYITEQVAALSQKVNLSPEQIILDEEYRLNRVARELVNDDFRDNPLEVQSELLAKAAREKTAELTNKDDLVIALRDTLIKVRDSSSRLTSISETAKNLKQEKSEWLAKEALFKAKVVQLEEELNKSNTQLNSTQQTLVSIQNQNNDLNALLEMEKSKVETLSQQQRLNAAAEPANNAKPIAVSETTETVAEPEPKQVAEQQDATPVVTETVNSEKTEPQQVVEELKTQQANNVVLEQKLKQAEAEKVQLEKDKQEIEAQLAVQESAPEQEPEIVKTSTIDQVIENSLEPEKETTSVSHDETLKALESARELIDILRSNDESSNEAAAEVVKTNVSTDAELADEQEIDLSDDLDSFASDE